MSQYYLMAQLPSLDCISDTAPLPITEERFHELCDQFLGKKSLRALKQLTLAPGKEREKSGSSLIDAWNDGERQLRIALGSARAGKMKKPFEMQTDALSMQLMQTAQAAVAMDDPMAAEQFLNQYRMNYLESLRPADYFSENSVFYYGLRLKLMMRMRKFDVTRGQEAYHKIYDSILRGAEQEVE